MTFVDHDETQVPQHSRPAGMEGQDAVVQHVRVGEDEAAVVARPVPVGQGGVAVVGRRADSAEPQGVQRFELVRGQRLGRREVERARARIAL